MYYLWSLLVTMVIFAAIQYNDYNKNPQKYNLYTASNLATFVMIFTLATISFYMILENNPLASKPSHKITTDSYVDQSALKKISENIYTGFNPRARTEGGGYVSD